MIWEQVGKQNANSRLYMLVWEYVEIYPKLEQEKQEVKQPHNAHIQTNINIVYLQSSTELHMSGIELNICMHRKHHVTSDYYQDTGEAMQGGEFVGPKFCGKYAIDLELKSVFSWCLPHRCSSPASQNWSMPSLCTHLFYTS